jgi:Tfp pilus assembly protein FimT
MSKRAGFTLMEAVMTCMLVSILALLVTPKISDYYAEVKLRSLGRRIVWHVRLCRQLATSRRLTHWAVFDVSGNSYTLYEEREDLPGKENRVPLRYLSAAFETDCDIEQQYAGLRLASVNIAGQNEIGFTLLGAALDANGQELVSDGVIVIRDVAGRQLSVSIVSRTGKAYLE